MRGGCIFYHSKTELLNGVVSPRSNCYYQPLKGLYLIHVELAHTCVITLDRNEIWAQDLYHSTALVEAAKSLAPSNKHNRTWQGTVPETSAKVYGGAWL